MTDFSQHSDLIETVIFITSQHMTQFHLLEGVYISIWMPLDFEDFAERAYSYLFQYLKILHLTVYAI